MSKQSKNAELQYTHRDKFFLGGHDKILVSYNTFYCQIKLKKNIFEALFSYVVHARQIGLSSTHLRQGSNNMIRGNMMWYSISSAHLRQGTNNMTIGKWMWYSVSSTRHIQGIIDMSRGNRMLYAQFPQLIIHRNI